MHFRSFHKDFEDLSNPLISIMVNQGIVETLDIFKGEQRESNPCFQSKIKATIQVSTIFTLVKLKN